MRKATLVELLAFAGGVKEEAGGMVQIFRTQPPLCAEDSEDSNWKNTTGSSTEVPSRLYSLSSVRMVKKRPTHHQIPATDRGPKGDDRLHHSQVIATQGFTSRRAEPLTEASQIGGSQPRGPDKRHQDYRMNRFKARPLILANTTDKKVRSLTSCSRPRIARSQGEGKCGCDVLKFALGAGKALVTSGATSAGYRVIY